MTSPVLFLIFSRPDSTARVFEAIRAARPERLYVAADGPRADREGEAERCSEARRIATQVDWPCEVRCLFHEENLGCRRAVGKGITWFFEHESEGIILEDDCIPSASFFKFCEELLYCYRNDPRIMCISGTSYLDICDTAYDYFFSKYPHMWGWATWRRAWRLCDLEMADWNDEDVTWLESLSDGSDRFVSSWTDRFNAKRDRHFNTWDYSWIYSCWRHYGLTCQPYRNLVQNIGFGSDATHTTWVGAPGNQLRRNEIGFPLRHPPQISRSPNLDRVTERHHWGIGDPVPPSKLVVVKTLARRWLERLPGGKRIIFVYRRIIYGREVAAAAE